MPTEYWSGTGHPVSPVPPEACECEDEWIAQYNCPPETVVTMSRYAAYLGIDDLEFWGVYRGDGPIDPPTRYWTGTDRRVLGDHLLRAETMIEQFMQVHLKPKWTAYGNGWYWEENGWQGNPHKVNWNRFIAGGKRATSIYREEAPITYAGNYGYVTVAHGGVGSASEVRTWYDCTELPIEYSCIEFGATNIALTFPRQRLVRPSVMNPDPDHTQERGIMWEDADNFLETLTVAREYHDASEQGEFVYSELCGCGGNGCDRCCQTACLVPSMPQVSTVNVWPATYDATTEVWGRTSCWLSQTPTAVKATYRSGLRQIPYELEDAVIRLAHTLMPDSPCPLGREPQHRFWMRDRAIREISIREVLNCPWGNTAGAWFAWNVVANHSENYGKGGGYL